MEMNLYVRAALVSLILLLMFLTTTVTMAMVSFSWPRHGEQRPYLNPESDTAQFWEVVQVYPGERVCVNKFIGLTYVHLRPAHWSAEAHKYIGAQSKVSVFTEADPTSGVLTFDEMDADGCVYFLGGTFPQTLELLAPVEPNSPPAFTVQAHPDSVAAWALFEYSGGLGRYLLWGIPLSLLWGFILYQIDAFRQKRKAQVSD
jgi:hypothetical protein